MNSTQTMNDRVRDVITGSGMQQGAFAQSIGLDASKLSKSLAGSRRFSSLDLARIADVGKVTVDWLLTGEELAIATAARRAAGSSSGDAMARAMRLTELRGVAADLGRPLPDSPAIAVGTQRSTRSAGLRLADEALRLVGDPQLVLSEELPDLLESRFAVDVAIVDLGGGFDGLAVQTPQSRLVLAAPTSVPARQRFTLAHELGHLLAGHDQDVHLDKDIFAPVGADATEVQANAFAASFLMPEVLLRARVKRGFDDRQFAELAMDFEVSPRALAIRLTQLKLIDKMAEAAFGALSGRRAAQLTGREEGLQRSIVTSTTPRPSRRLASDLFAAYEGGLTTLRPVAAVLGVDPVKLRDDLEAERQGN